MRAEQHVSKQLQSYQVTSTSWHTSRNQVTNLILVYLDYNTAQYNSSFSHQPLPNTHSVNDQFERTANRRLTIRIE